ncbi:hypothetical protein PAT3040_06685 [Paenibacillus agaridevorans]|uniref:Uncharacterized protein n=1 Tax=Paenibacillus agaridevorans TaxID=171404 RepID=A0A2R5EZ70_9BACL|nr:hypothetical protein PAT3040_06685 [Paenibacillus agaridevorans]
MTDRRSAFAGASAEELIQGKGVQGIAMAEIVHSIEQQDGGFFLEGHAGFLAYGKMYSLPVL